jgi:hypothetical protein
MKFVLLLLGISSTLTLLGIEVVLASRPSQNLAIFGDLEALAIRLIGFHRHLSSFLLQAFSF